MHLAIFTNEFYCSSHEFSLFSMEMLIMQCIFFLLNDHLDFFFSFCNFKYFAIVLCVFVIFYCSLIIIQMSLIIILFVLFRFNFY